MADWYRLDASGVVLEVAVRPKAGRDRIGAVRSGRLVVELKAAPEGGRANEALVALLAKKLGVRRSEVAILRGKTARKKTVRVEGRFEARDLERLTQ